MNLLNRVGGALLLLGLGVAVIIGFQSPTGRQFWDGIWQAGATVLGYVRTQIERIDGTSIAGNAAAAVGIAAVSLVIIFILLKKPISLRLFTFLVIAPTAAAFVLYDPTILG